MYRFHTKFQTHIIKPNLPSIPERWAVLCLFDRRKMRKQGLMLRRLPRFSQTEGTGKRVQTQACLMCKARA